MLVSRLAQLSNFLYTKSSLHCLIFHENIQQLKRWPNSNPGRTSGFKSDLKYSRVSLVSTGYIWFILFEQAIDKGLFTPSESWNKGKQIQKTQPKRSKNKWQTSKKNFAFASAFLVNGPSVDPRLLIYGKKSTALQQIITLCDCVITAVLEEKAQVLIVTLQHSILIPDQDSYRWNCCSELSDSQSEISTQDTVTVPCT